MAEREPVLTGADALAALFDAKALAELGDADALLSPAPNGWSGKPQASVALVVGPAFAVAADGITVLGEAVASALGKALAALGVDPADVFAISTRPLADASKEAIARRLELAIEAVDPGLVLALDAVAAGDLAAAFSAETLEAGRPVRVRGRVLGAVGDFAASLDAPGAKAGVWAAMRKAGAEAGLKPKGRPKAPQDVTPKPVAEKG